MRRVYSAPSRRIALSRIAAGALAVSLSACEQPERQVATPIHAAWESPAPRPAPPKEEWQPPVDAPASRPVPAVAASAPADRSVDDVVATVGGEAIARGALLDALVESHGVDLLEKFVLLAALKQKGAAAGITITEEDVEAEYLDALQRIAEPVQAGASSAFDRAGAERLLNDFLLAKNISRFEFRLRMRQNAYLRKLADREVVVDERELPAEYQRAYGERVKVRCIQMTSPESAQKVREALEAGKDFELVARTMSENPVTAANGGLLPPFSRFDDVPKLLRDTAFALPPGQVSPTIRENDAFYIIRVEQRFAPSQVGMENVKDELRRRIRDRLVRRRMDEMAGQVFRAAAVEIRDGRLRDAFRERFPDARLR